MLNTLEQWVATAVRKQLGKTRETPSRIYANVITAAVNEALGAAAETILKNHQLPPATLIAKVLELQRA